MKNKKVTIMNKLKNFKTEAETVIKQQRTPEPSLVNMFSVINSTLVLLCFLFNDLSISSEKTPETLSSNNMTKC